MITFLLIVIAILLAVIGWFWSIGSALGGLFVGVISALGGDRDAKRYLRRNQADTLIPYAFWLTAAGCFGWALWRIFEALKSHLHWT